MRIRKDSFIHAFFFLLKSVYSVVTVSEVLFYVFSIHQCTCKEKIVVLLGPAF